MLTEVIIILITFSSCSYNPGNTRLWSNVGLMLGQRQRQWANISPISGQRLVFAGCGLACNVHPEITTSLDQAVISAK